MDVGDIRGRVFQINFSYGGVPKRAVASGQLTVLGFSGDQQANLDVHGGPERAVCLYSLERILALQGEGHPIYPGAIGENITISGLAWEQLQPGLKLRLGSLALIEITRYTTPCNSIAPAFLAENYGRVSQSQYPDWSRVYARVLQPGYVRTADPVIGEI